MDRPKSKSEPKLLSKSESQDGAAATGGRLLGDDDVFDVLRLRRHDHAPLNLKL